MRALRPAAAGSRRVGGRRCSQPSLRLRSTCPPLSPRALMRARYGGAALGLSSSGQLVPAARIDGAECARACCAGAAAKAPTQRVARRKRRRRWCLGLRLDAHGGGSGGGGDGSHHLCSTPSSCDGVECVFAFPTGARAIGRVGARRFDAAGVSNTAPTGTVARKRRRIARRCGTASRTGGGDDGAIVSTRHAPPSSLHAPRPAIVAAPPGACA
jgi:hypothetical protein